MDLYTKSFELVNHLEKRESEFFQCYLLFYLLFSVVPKILV